MQRPYITFYANPTKILVSLAGCCIALGCCTAELYGSPDASTMKSAIMGDIHELEKAENFGRLMAIFLWIYGLMSPVAGLIADRINRKWLIVGSLGVWSGVTLTMGYATSFGQLYVLRAIMGISEALYIPAGLALIADYHRGSTRSLAVGIHIDGIVYRSGTWRIWCNCCPYMVMADSISQLWSDRHSV